METKIIHIKGNGGSDLTIRIRQSNTGKFGISFTRDIPHIGDSKDLHIDEVNIDDIRKLADAFSYIVENSDD